MKMLRFTTKRFSQPWKDYKIMLYFEQTGILLSAEREVQTYGRKEI